ncbi:type VI secretion system tube protein Hcp [bacterium]|nr:type VI secretion system tube protein Hcp [bacterium]
MKSSAISWVCVLAMLLAGMLRAQDRTVFLKIGDIAGESRVAGFEGWIEARSIGLEGPVFGKGFGSMGVAKEMDASTPKLILANVKGSVIREVSVVLQKPTNDGLTVLAVLKLRDVRISRVEQVGGREGRVLEKYLLDYGSILFSYPTDDVEDKPKFVDLDDSVDTDNDGMSDRFEDFYGLDKTVNDALLDSDKDGLSNYAEFRLGFNPKSARSFFSALGSRVPAKPGEFKVSWEAKPGLSYDIYGTDKLGVPFKFIKRVSAEDYEGKWNVGTQGSSMFYQVRPVIE